MSATVVRRRLLAGTFTLLAFRVLLSLFRSGPLVVADEIGYLTNARLLAGGTPGEMSAAPFYRGGYSLVIAPIFGIARSPDMAYHLVLAVNAVLAASMAPLLYLLLTRVFHIAPHVALWPSLAAATYPSITVFAQVALSENVLMPLTVIWLLCFATLLQAPRARSQIAASTAFAGCAVALFAVHGRMIVAVALTVLAFLILIVRRRLPLAAPAVGAGVVVGGIVGIRRLDNLLVAKSYGGKHVDEVGERLSNLNDVHGVLAFGRNFVGQSWYIVAATLATVVLYLLGDGLRTIRRPALRGGGASGLVLILLVGLGLGLLAVSALSFRVPRRPDMLVYGRYVEVIVPPFVAVALASLANAVRPPRVRLTLCLVVAATALVAVLRASIHPSGAPNRWNIASLPFLTLRLGELSLIGAGTVALAAVVTLSVLIRRAPTLVAPVTAGVFLLTTAVTLNNPVFSGQRSFYPPGWTSPEAAAPEATVVAFDTDHRGSRYIYQWFMPHARFVLFAGRAEFPGTRYVFGSREWGTRYPELDATRLWVDAGRESALFEVRQATTTRGRPPGVTP